MFTKYAKYSLTAIMALGFLGCTSPRTITLDPTRPPITAPTTTNTKVPTTTPIKEEILIKDNPDLGNRVDVPQNYPTLGVKVVDEPSIDRLNGEVMERMAFPLDEYKYLKKTGRSTVSGKVYLTNSHTEENILGKKLRLYLNPVTSYSRQWYNESYLGGYKMSTVDRRLNAYLKLSYSNESGEFDFFGIPQGSYYLIGSMRCGEECGLNSTQTIRLVKEISVGSGVTRVELNKRVP
ncbi:MAG: hypothetical protein K0U38_05710 [Epsilonproteobacteria bacterium]|nr:hypothetical protein [Campylobacterota bacterium]